MPPSSTQDEPALVDRLGRVRAFRYAVGEPIVLMARSPDFPAHVYIDQFDADGMVLHFQPNEALDTMLMPPGSTIEVGVDPRTRTAAFAIIASAPPRRDELVVALATSAPLHDAPRPIREPAAPYLDWLRERLDAARAADPGFRGEWVHFFLEITDGRRLTGP